MADPTPAPYGDLTRRWTLLPAAVQQAHACRLFDTAWDPDAGRLTPGQYEGLVHAALADDAVALGWLATTHRPMLLVAGRVLLEDDPAEWGAVCLELLQANLARARLQSGRWLRRNIAVRLKSDVAREARRHLERRRMERATDPVGELVRLAPAHPGPELDRDGALADDLARVMRRLDRPTFEALHAIADGGSMVAVARRFDLTPAAMRQRVNRARAELRPELACYQRRAS